MEIDRERFAAALGRSAGRAGSVLNPDEDDLGMLIEGLLENRKRYGYPSCPCRLSSGDVEKDRDIVCPCRYRGPDLEEFGACYCALFVTGDWVGGKVEQMVVPDRRPPELQLQ